jgi:hypothetical protein
MVCIRQPPTQPGSNSAASPIVGTPASGRVMPLQCNTPHGMASSLLITSNGTSCAVPCQTQGKLTWYGTTSGRWHSRTRERAWHPDCQRSPGCYCQPHQLPLLLLAIRQLLQQTQHCLNSSLCWGCLQSTCCCTTGGSSSATADQQDQAGCCC